MSIAAAHAAAGAAENAMFGLAGLGRVDDAFAVAEGYYFGRGFTVSAMRFSSEQGTYTRLADRRTMHLFFPPAAAMRADRRFADLVRRIGLERYWRLSGTQPDYRRG